MVPIEVVDLHKSYRNGILRRSFPALKGVSFRVDRGEVFGLLGPNGAGKTTLIKILLGIARLTSGSATLLGRPAGARLGRAHVGYLPENLRIAGHHTARSALDYYGRLSGLPGKEIRLRRDVALEQVGLRDRSMEPIKRYSKGMLQRLGLAQAMLHDPDLLILDEPTDGLDPVGRSRVRGVLRELRDRGKTVFLNSHLLQEVEMVCDRVAILDRGSVRATGSVREIAGAARAGIELEVTLAGSGEAVEAALRRRQLGFPRPTAEGHYGLITRFVDQSAVDEWIDELRGGGVSIVGLRRRQASLEDVFLDLLSRGES